MSEELQLTGEIQAYEDGIPTRIVGKDSPWSIKILWKTTDPLVESDGKWQLTLHIESLEGQYELVLPEKAPLTVPAASTSEIDWYSQELKQEGNNLPEGMYKLSAKFIYISEQENSQPKSSYLDGPVIHIYDDR